MRTIYNLLFFFCVAGPGLLFAQQVSPELQAKWDSESAVPDNPLLDHLPSSLPDRVTILPVSSNAEEIAIIWRTDTTIKSSRVEIIAGDSLTFPKENRQRLKGSYNVVHYKDYPMHYHKVIVKDLDPGTLYKYRVGNSPDWSAWHTYRHRNFEDTVRLLYFGDTQNGICDHTARIYKEAAKKFDNAGLAVYIGDLINHADNDYEWSEWHTATADINTSLPVIATPGNHEYLKNLEGKKTTLSAYWTSAFPFPYEWAAGPFYMDFGFVRFIILNSNEKMNEQAEWLDSLLNDTKQDWVVIVSHHPVFSGAKNRENKGLQENWLPVIRKHKEKIGLVLQGHDHTYARGGLPERQGSIANPSYPAFTVTVIGDKYYELDRQPWMDVAIPNVSSYQYIEMTRDKIVYKAYSETNHLIDQFEINR